MEILMRNRSNLQTPAPRAPYFIALAAIVCAVGGCTVHPSGERAERTKALAAGNLYAPPFEKRDIKPLSPQATPDDMVTYALLTNADVEQKYWEWRSALEQVPQEGTQRTNLSLSLSTMIEKGNTAARMTDIGAGNDAANNLVLPSKLETAAKIALENARAAGWRFDQARYELRAKVLAAYDDYALTAELLRREEENGKLLELTEKMIRVRIGTGAAVQQDLLKSQNEREASENEAASLKAKAAEQRAALNMLLNRDAAADLVLPTELPKWREIPADDSALLKKAEEENAEVRALAAEIAAKHSAIKMSKQEYLPEFGINVSTDLAGQAQNLAGAVMVPVLRYDAIDAGIRQAEANLRGAEAAARGFRVDLRGRIVMDLLLIRESEREVAFLEKRLLPRARQIVSASQTSYGVGESTMLDLLEGERGLIGLQRLAAEMRVTREKSLADLEGALGAGVSGK